MTRAFAIGFAAQAVDRASGVIRGVSVITEGEAKGHNCYVDTRTLSQIKAACEQFTGGMKVVDRHTRGTDSVFATVGVLKNFRIEGTQLKADLHLLKSEENREKLFEMAETMPDTFGLSVAFSGPEETIEGKIYSRCTEIYNAALVDVPAANPSGLFAAIITPEGQAKLDAARTGNMSPEDFKKFSDENNERLGKIEAAIAVLAEFAAFKKQLTELAAAVADRKTLIQEMGQSIAKEFAQHVGTGAAVKPNPVADEKKEPTAIQKFEAVVRQAFKETGSKSKAYQAGIKAEPLGYEQAKATRIDIKFN